jgi:hypothetical protein
MKNETIHDALAGFERRITLRLYAFGVVIVLAEAALQHFWK